MENFIEKDNYIYRFCSLEEILGYIRTGQLSSNHYEFISLTNASLEIAALRFFNERHKFVMVFDRTALLKQGLIEVGYNYKFLSEHPDIFYHIVDNSTNENYDDDDESDVFGTASYPEMQVAYKNLKSKPDDRDLLNFFNNFMYDEFSTEKEYVIPFIDGIKGNLVTIIPHPHYVNNRETNDGLKQIVEELMNLKNR